MATDALLRKLAEELLNSSARTTKAQQTDSENKISEKHSKLSEL
jgi:hypothetical protein